MSARIIGYTFWFSLIGEIVEDDGELPLSLLTVYAAPPGWPKMAVFACPAAVIAQHDPQAAAALAGTTYVETLTRLRDGQPDPPGRMRVFNLPIDYGDGMALHRPTRWRMDLQEIVSDDGAVLLTSQGATPKVWTPTPAGAARPDLKRLIWGACRYVCTPLPGRPPLSGDYADRADFLAEVRAAVAEVRADDKEPTIERVAEVLRPHTRDARRVLHRQMTTAGGFRRWEDVLAALEGAG